MAPADLMLLAVEIWVKSRLSVGVYWTLSILGESFMFGGCAWVTQQQMK
jgi:hypothetical protein